MPHEAANTRHWNSLDLHNRSNDHLVDEELMSLYGQRDHWDQLGRPDRSDDVHATGEFLWSAEQQDHGNLPLHHDRENLHDL